METIMKELIANLMKPLAKNPYLYAFILILLIVGGVRMFKIYVESPREMIKTELLKK